MTDRRLAPHWRVWLDIWCLGVFVFGLLLAGVVSDATSGPISALLTMLHANGDNTLTPGFRFGLGLQGALTMGWAVTMFAAFRAAEKLGAEGTPTWRLVTIGLLFWYVIDSSISVATGFTLNAVSNTLLVIAYLVPVLASGVLKTR
jgi:hypothetical protein